MDPKEIKYWVEIFNEEEECWIPVDPVLNESYEENKLPIISKLNHMPCLFVLSFQKYLLKDQNSNRQFKDIYIEDVSPFYCER